MDQANSARQFQVRGFVLLLCVLAAIHVFVFSATFPFFNDVDEPEHFDLVVRYSNGQIPRGMENFSAESSVYLSLYSSCAYLGTAEMFPGGQFPPPAWTLPVEKPGMNCLLRRRPGSSK
jgi:hypothetical protein